MTSRGREVVIDYECLEGNEENIPHKITAKAIKTHQQLNLLFLVSDTELEDMFQCLYVIDNNNIY